MQLRNQKRTAQPGTYQKRTYRRRDAVGGQAATTPNPPTPPHEPVAPSNIPRPRTPNFDAQFPSLIETVRTFGTNAATNATEFWRGQEQRRKRAFATLLRDLKKAAEAQGGKGSGIAEIPSSEEEGDAAPGMGTSRAGSLETEQPRRNSAKVAGERVVDPSSPESNQTGYGQAAKNSTALARIEDTRGFEAAKHTFKPAQVASSPSSLISPPRYFPGAFEKLQPKEPKGTPFVAHPSTSKDKGKSEKRSTKGKKATNISFTLPEVQRVVNTLYFSVAESNELSDDTREFLNSPNSEDEDEELKAAIEASIYEAFSRKKKEKTHTVNCSASAIVIDDSDEAEVTSTPKKKGKGVDPAEKGPKYDELKFLNEFARTGKTPVREKKRDKKKNKKEKENKHTYSRGSSQMPEGGFIPISTPPPPPSPPSSSSSSDADESSSSSDDSSSTNTPSVPSKRRKSSKKHYEKDETKKKEALKNALASLRMKPPMVYDGRADLDHFDQWIFEIETWRDLYELPEEVVIKLMVNFVSHLASKFYMKHVAKCQDEWTMKGIYEGTFDYCFPIDFKLKLREKLTKAAQNKKKVRDFVRDLQSLAQRFPDVTSRQLNQIFWEGLNRYIRLDLIGQGIDPETHTLEKMVKYAVRIENKEEARRLEESRFQSRPQGRSWGKDSETKENKSTGSKNTESNSRNNRSQNNHKSDNKKDSRNSTKPQKREELSKEQRDQLQAENKCFNCREVGHNARNCDQRKTAKAPHIHTRNAGIRFSYLDTLAELKKQANVQASVARVQIKDEPIFEQPMNVVKEVLLRVQEAFEDAADPLEAPKWDIKPEERFMATRFNDDEIEVTDWLNDEYTYLVTKEDLEAESLDINVIARRAVEANRERLEQEKNRELTERDFGAPDKEHPARGWLWERFTWVIANEEGLESNELLRGRIHVRPDKEGYIIKDVQNDVIYHIAHKQVRDRTFKIKELLDCPAGSLCRRCTSKPHSMTEHHAQERALVCCLARPTNSPKVDKDSSGGRAGGRAGGRKKKAELKEDLPVETSGMIPRDQKRCMPHRIILNGKNK